MGASVVVEIDGEGPVAYTFTSQQQTAGETKEGSLSFVLIVVGIQLIELRFHCWIASCQFLD